MDSDGMATERSTTFVLLRHAEKADDGSRDPALAAAGQARAAVIAGALRDAPLRAVYATAYRRTQQTAVPVAAAHRLAVLDYAPAEPAEAFARRLRNAYPAGTVLVIGHSNTVPALAAALCGCSVGPTHESVYDRWIEIRVDTDGRTQYAERRY